MSPTLNTRTVRVTLEPGRSPVPVHTTANIATSLVFHDSTGQPWPVTSVTNGGPSFFQVLHPELPDGNLLNVMPTQGYATSTLVVTLQDRDIPLVIRLESDSVRAPRRKADALVLFQLAHHGPKAALPIIRDIKETADSSMLAFLTAFRRKKPCVSAWSRVPMTCLLEPQRQALPENDSYADVASLDSRGQRGGQHQML